MSNSCIFGLCGQLITPRDMLEKAVGLLTPILGKPDFVESSYDENHWTSAFWDEINEDKYDFLEPLQKAGIPYDFEIKLSPDISNSAQHCRFTEDGKKKLILKSDEETGISYNDLNRIVCSEDSDFHKVKKIKKLLAAYQKKFIPLSDINQEQYGKLHVTYTLLGAA